MCNFSVTRNFFIDTGCPGVYSDDMMRFKHEEIKASRVAAGLSINKAAKRADWARQQWSSYEKGKNLTVETLIKIWDVLGVGTDKVRHFFCD